MKADVGINRDCMAHTMAFCHSNDVAVGQTIEPGQVEKHRLG